MRRPTTLLLALLRTFKSQYDDAMFAPKPRDRAAMAKALHDRFGDRVRLLDVPVVDRDVNGVAGVVRGGPRAGLYRSGDRILLFERLRGRDACLMAYRPYELADLRRTFLARVPEAALE